MQPIVCQQSSHSLGHESRFSKFKKIETISSIFYDHNAMRFEINYKKKTVKKKPTNACNNMLLNYEWITEEIETPLEDENTMIQNLWDAAKTVLRGNFVAIQAYLRKQEKYQISNLKRTPKAIRERETNKTPSW